jgi:DHA2 family multidrug resistance protein
MLSERGQVHQAQYVETLNPLNYNYAQRLQEITHSLMSRGFSQYDAAKAAPAEIYHSLLQQAQILSYIDVFHVLMWIVFAALPLVLLMQKAKPGGGEGGAAA